MQSQLTRTSVACPTQRPAHLSSSFVSVQRVPHSAGQSKRAARGAVQVLAAKNKNKGAFVDEGDSPNPLLLVGGVAVAIFGTAIVASIFTPKFTPGGESGEKAFQADYKQEEKVMPDPKPARKGTDSLNPGKSAQPSPNNVQSPSLKTRASVE